MSPRPRALLVLHHPPPVHGAAVVGDVVRRSATVRAAVEPHVIKLRGSETVAEIGRLAPRKLATHVGLGAAVARALARFRPEVVYYTAAPAGWAFYRDLSLLTWVAAWCRAAGARLLLHYHMLGASAFARGHPLAAAVYRGSLESTELVLLSPGHAEDFRGLGEARRIHVVPNGVADPLGETFEASLRTRLTHRGPPRILFLSHLDASKGWRAFVDRSTRASGARPARSPRWRTRTWRATSRGPDCRTWDQRRRPR